MLGRLLTLILTLLVASHRGFQPEPITLDRIYQTDHSWTATLSAEKVVTLIATGDVMPGRTIHAANVKSGDFTYQFQKIAPFLSSADITFINLESPIVDPCPVLLTGFTFCTDPRILAGLNLAGIDVTNLANNHISNFGPAGIQSTIKYLESAGILTSGISEIPVKVVKNTRFSFLGFNALGEPPDQIIMSQIAIAKSQSDVVIIQFHWGNEYTTVISPQQKHLAHLAIDSGADLVIGNHPHWVQPAEIYNGKLIIYAHGNTVFDQNWSTKTREGVLGKYTFYGSTLVDAQFFPVFINLLGQPDFSSPTTTAE